MRQIIFTILAFLPLTFASADTEPNNTWSTALPLPEGRTIAGTQSDDDWYVINVVDGTNRVLIDLTFSDADGNIDMIFHDDSYRNAASPGPAPGTNREWADSPTDHEFIDNNVSTRGPGTYYIRVFGDDAGNEYTLTWNELATNDDGFEDNDSSAEPAALAQGIVALGAQVLDEDWFSIEVTSGNERVLASLRFEETGRLDVFLLDTSGNTLDSSADPAPGVNEAIDVDLTLYGPGTYHLRVTGDNNGDGYALNWAGVPPASKISFPVPAVSNEVPVATPNTVSTTKDTAYTFSVSDFTYSDNDGDSLVSVTLTNLSLAGGALTHVGGSQVNSADTLTPAQLDALKYTPPAGSTGSPLATFDFTVNDLMGEGTVAAQMGINVTDVTGTATGSSSSGALGPVWLLVLLLAGMLARQRR